MQARAKTYGTHGAINTTQDCETICVQTIQYCLEMGGAHVEKEHMQLLQDCADICETTAKLHSRRSAQHQSVTSACADICDLCAAACEQFIGDPQMKACANQCHLCAIVCRQSLAGTMGRQQLGPFGPFGQPGSQFGQAGAQPGKSQG